MENRLEPVEPTPAVQDARTVLVVRLGAIGDLIVTLPALAGLRRLYPRAQIHLVANSRPARLVLGRGLVDRFTPYDRAVVTGLAATAADDGGPPEPAEGDAAGHSGATLFDLAVLWVADPAAVLIGELAHVYWRHLVVCDPLEQTAQTPPHVADRLLASLDVLTGQLAPREPTPVAATQPEPGAELPERRQSAPIGTTCPAPDAPSPRHPAPAPGRAAQPAPAGPSPRHGRSAPGGEAHAEPGPRSSWHDESASAVAARAEPDDRSPWHAESVPVWSARPEPDDQSERHGESVPGRATHLEPDDRSSRHGESALGGATRWVARPAVPSFVPTMAERAEARRIWAELGLAATGPERHRPIVVHPGSGSSQKNWPADRYGAVIDALLRRGQRVALVAGPADRDVLRQVEQLLWRWRHAGQLVRLPALPLPVLAAVLARAGAFLGNDSGITHLAAAVGTPTVAIFGPTDATVWGPRGRWVRILNRPPSEPVATGGMRLAQPVGVDDVLAAVDEALDQDRKHLEDRTT